MYLTLIMLPLLGSIASGLFGRKIGINGAHVITCCSVITTTILVIIIFVEVGINNIPVTINVGKWVDVEALYVLWNFKFDSLTVSMLLPVLIVSSLVHVYSISYMSHDPYSILGRYLNGGKLSNSGKFLKLLVPNYSWKIISGWSNYSDKVIS